MIYLTCKRIPDGTTAVGLYEKAVAEFDTTVENIRYIEQIYKRCDKSATESLFALCTLAELAAHAQISPTCKQLTLERSSNGKPYFINSNWQFNVSHSGGYVAVALSDEGAVGIDVETAQISAEKAQDLAKRFFTEAEQTKVAENTDTFRVLWSKKESTAKYWGFPLGQFLKSEKNEKAFKTNVKTQIIEMNSIWVTVCTSIDSSEIILVT